MIILGCLQLADECFFMGSIYLWRRYTDKVCRFSFAYGCDAMNDAFYKTVRWKRLREKMLRRDGYICQISKRYGKIVQADTVHHIFPKEDYPEYQWEPWNLISLSTEQHNALHVRDSHQLTAKGEELRNRTARRQGLI